MPSPKLRSVDVRCTHIDSIRSLSACEQSSGFFLNLSQRMPSPELRSVDVRCTHIDSTRSLSACEQSSGFFPNLHSLLYVKKSAPEIGTDYSNLRNHPVFLQNKYEYNAPTYVVPVTGNARGNLQQPYLLLQFPFSEMIFKAELPLPSTTGSSL